MEASSAHAKAYLLMGGRFAGATATGTASSVLIVQLARAAGGDRLARLVTPSIIALPWTGCGSHLVLAALLYIESIHDGLAA
jgi:hypothetical protein